MDRDDEYFDAICIAAQEGRIDLGGDPTFDEGFDSDATTDEQWKPVTGFEGIYDVSNRGSVRRSLGAPATNSSTPGRLLNLDDHNGYRRVSLSRDGSPSRLLVHRLVARLLFFLPVAIASTSIISTETRAITTCAIWSGRPLARTSITHGAPDCASRYAGKPRACRNSRIAMFW